MANTCYDTDLLQYSGTSQSQRALRALLAQYANVDERTTAQLILFAKKYGAYLNYFDETNQPVGDWQAFMSGDVSVTIAAIADWKAKDLTPFVSNVNDEVHNAANSEEAKKYFKTIFDLVFTLASQLDAALQHLPADVRYTDFLSVAITSNLALPLALLYNYYTTFRDALLSLIDSSSNYIDPLMPVSPVVFSGDFNPASLSKAWAVSSLTVPQITLQSADVKGDIGHVLTHNLFTGPLQLFINGIINIVSKTPAYLDETLNDYPSHQPHYALYLAFLRLFRFAQDHLNSFTQNHLDFYYKEVLQLTNRNAEPGFVHLLFELQKNTEQYLLKKNTAFKAGKDAAGKDIFYNVVNDVVLQKTTVQKLQSLYLDKSANGALYASSVANSDDGNGANLTSADNSWSAFKNAGKKTGTSLGFAIASNLLFLNEGKRVITFRFECDSLSAITENDLQSLFTIRFTAKKDWYTATSYTAKIFGNAMEITVALQGDAPPIIPYSQKIHKGNYNTLLPMAEVTLNSYASYQKIKGIVINNLILTVSATVKNLSLQNKDGSISAAKPFKPFGDFPSAGDDFIIGSKEIFQKPLTALQINFDWKAVDTSLAQAAADNANYIISNVLNLNEETSLLNAVSSAGNSATVQADATSSFKPIMSAESMMTAASSSVESISQTSMNELVNQKANSGLFLSVFAATAPANLLALYAGEWSSSPLKSNVNLLSTPVAVSGSLSSNIEITDIDFTDNTDYNVKSTAGFVKLQLATSDYSFATYLHNTQAALEQTKVTVNSDKGVVTSYTVDPPKLGLPAPQLIANSVSVNYTAQTNIDFTDNSATSFSNSSAFYYHNEPFGSREMHPSLTKDAMTLLPVFNLDNDTSGDDSGELWIGLQDAFPQETLTLLFQVLDGSSNPLKSMINLRWYYLFNNNWLLFDKGSVVDETNNLTRSGIVTVSLPNDAVVGNTRADASLAWIKLVADKDTDAVCKLIAVRTNAAKAVFAQDLTTEMEYTTALPASTITKPVAAIATLKKTEQPYASFGGRLHETDDRFYIRVSERLRHKHRAVTSLDYERLILDYFPQIHKAKAINHTGFIISQNTNTNKYSEVLPGYVMVVTVPDLNNLPAANLLRPYTSIGLIEEIQQYLDSLTSSFVKLQVSNPQFEEVQFDFGVTFLPNYDVDFYKKQLNDEIEQFLTPWANGSGKDIEFGGKIEKSVVLNFVEERPYVDFVTNFQMNQFIRDEEGTITDAKTNIEEAIASTARSILVSYNNTDANGVITRHLIQSPANCNN